MKNKKTLLGLLLIVVMLLSTALFVSCKKEENPDTGKGEIYYLYENGELNKSSFIQLKDGKWSDDDNENGTYVVSGTSITIYLEMMGEKEEYAKGTLKDGVLTLTIMGTEITYCKEGKTPSGTPSTPDEPEPGKQDEAVITAIKGAEINGTSIFMLVGKTTDSVSLSNKVTCSEGSVWKLYYDKLGQMEIPTKIAAGQSGELDDGDNTFYIVVTSGDSTKVNVYELKIHRQHEITVNYYDGENLLHAVKTVSGEEFGADYLPDIKGYTFNYWKISKYQKYSATVLYESISLYVDKTANKYIVSLNANGGNEIVDNDIEITFDKSFKLQVPTREGYTFSGWYVGNPYAGKNERLTNEKGESLSVWNIPEDTTVNAKWEAQENSVTLNVNDANAGTVSGSGEYKYDSEVWISAQTKNGYVWLGWYDVNNNLVSSDLTYKFKMGFAVTYTAKWSKVTVSKNISDAGTVTSSDDKYILGQEIGITAKSYPGYDWLGWYKDDVLLTKELEYNFKASDENVTYTAKWKIADELKNFEFESGASYCEITGIKDKTITELVIPDCVTGIGNNAFNDCGDLISVTVPNNVKWIGEGAFGNCRSLKEMRLPFVGRSGSAGGYESVFGYIFGYYTAESAWSGSTCQYWDDSASKYHKYYNYFIPETLKEVTITGSHDIPYHAFYNCNMLTSVTIGNGVKKIGEESFKNCGGISVTIPSSVQRIYYSAFEYSSCASVNYAGTIDQWAQIAFDTADANPLNRGGNLYINNELVTKANITTATSINSYAFYGCKSLTSVTIGESVTVINKEAFYGCNNLEEITLPFVGLRDGAEGFTGLFGYIFGYTKLNSVSTGHYFYDASSKVYYCYNNPESLKKVTVTGRIDVPDRAFYGCSSLTNITIGNSVTSIGSYALSGCSSLTSITIGNNVTSIGSYAFSGCSSLTSVNYSGTVDQWVQIKGLFAIMSSNTSKKLYINNELVTEVNITTATKINAYAFMRCESLTSVTIGNSVTEIGSSAFEACSNLKSVTMGNGLTSTGDYSFKGCQNLKSITIGNSVTEIGYEVFYNCSSLVDVVIPNSVTEIGSGAFYNCSSLVDVVIPDSVTSIGASAFFYCESLTNMTIPDGVTSIGENAFYNCSNMTSVTIGSGIQSIYSSAFRGCSELENINYTGTIDQWVQIYFSNSEANPVCYTKKLYINNELITEVNVFAATKVNDFALYNCESLKSVTIGGDVKRVGTYAFYNCKNLENVTIAGDVAGVGVYAFGGCDNLLEMTLPFAGKNATATGYESMFGYIFGYETRDTNSYTVSKATYQYKGTATSGKDVYYYYYIPEALRSVTITGPGNIFVGAFRNCGNLTEVTIGNAVKGIGDEAFRGCTGLRKITIPFVGNSIDGQGSTHFGCIFGAVRADGNKTWVPSALKEVIITGGSEIDSSAFSNCKNLESITLPGSVTHVNKDAFYNCTGLVRVNYVGEVDQWVQIAFSNYSSNPLYYVKKLYINNELVEDVNITSAKSIEQYAFYTVDSLRSVVIGKNVKRIEKYAFDDCVNLQNVYYMGTEEEWESIFIGSNNSCLETATRYYYSESKPVGSGNYWYYVDGEIVVW